MPGFVWGGVKWSQNVHNVELNLGWPVGDVQFSPWGGGVSLGNAETKREACFMEDATDKNNPSSYLVCILKLHVVKGPGTMTF